MKAYRIPYALQTKVKNMMKGNNRFREKVAQLTLANPD
jgi:hypothetical protein